MEHLDRGFEFVGGERDDIGIGAVAEHHGLLLQRALERGNVVAQPRGFLEIERGCSVVHLLPHVPDQPIGLARQEVAEVQNDLAMLVGADSADARCRALVDVPE